MEQVNFIIEHRLKAVKGKTELKRLYAREFPDSITFEKDYREAEKIIGEYYNRDTVAGTAEIAMHLWTLYDKSYKLQDYRECRNILKQIHDITISRPPQDNSAKEVDIFARPAKRKAGG